ncbi:MAG: Putative defective protein IntQ [Candidatus Celerinatantimonas neptuna]|nr:MAG: Putative defective protein IntQ [Candidatus Celerinatantimonas neptuna]
MGTERTDLKGVTIRDNKTIYISFMYHGKRCREPLRGLPPTKSNLRYAARKKAAVEMDIEKGIFDYLEHFPNSRSAILLGEKTKTETTVSCYLEAYMESCLLRGLSPSTLIGYRKCITALKPLHDVYISEVTPALIKRFITQASCSLKTMRNILSVLRSSLDEGITDGVIKINPCVGVNPGRYIRKEDKLSTRGQNKDVDPFTPAEEKAIIKAAESHPQWQNLFRFWLHSGLRTSELIALKWDDVDWINHKVSVVEALVSGITKSTKTRAGRRMIELDSEAMHALHQQKEHTFLHSDYIFHDPRLKTHWQTSDSVRKKAWQPTLKKAGVRYRRPYNCRHTFACRHISSGANLWWLAEQMGHASPEMLFRHYGSYMREYDHSEKQSHNINS